MDIATCTEDAHTYTAVEFASLEPNQLERKRRMLICYECRQPAFFRKQSRSGRGACFGARPHLDRCNLAAADNDIQLPGIGDDQDEFINPGDRIVIELAYGAQDEQIHLEANAAAPRRPRGGRHIGEGGARNAEMHRRLSTLLRMLVTAPNFRYSEQIIALANQPEMLARDFFVHLSDITPEYRGQFRGFWGQLTDARPGSGALWLNSGGRGDMSFCLPEEHINAVMERYRLSEEEDFSGSYILVLGTLQISQYNKMFCVIDDPAVMSLR